MRLVCVNEKQLYSIGCTLLGAHYWVLTIGCSLLGTGMFSALNSTAMQLTQQFATGDAHSIGHSQLGTHYWAHSVEGAPRKPTEYGVDFG